MGPRVTRRLVTGLLLAAVLLLPGLPAHAAQSDLALIDKQAWRLDPEAGTPAPGYEEEFEKTRRDLYTFIEVFWINGDRMTVFLFLAEDGFFVTNSAAALSSGKDGWFTATLPKLTPDADNVAEYAVKDPDTLLFRRKSGTYVYTRIPDFNPPRDEFTGLNPLPWK